MNLPLKETQRFLERFAQSGRLLEVGCGAGELAVLLGQSGWKVLGIDVDPKRVKAARGRGVEVQQVDVLKFDAPPFDVVLVTHSLHHVSPLDAAVQKLKQLVKPGGWLVVEEYDHAAMDPATSAWLQEREELLVAAGLLRPRHHQHPKHGPSHAAHAHHSEVHRSMPIGEQMRAALAVHFDVTAHESAPYLYRRLCEQLLPCEHGDRIAQLTLDQERRALSEGRIRPLGLRLAAQPRVAAQIPHHRQSFCTLGGPARRSKLPAPGRN